MRSTSSGTGRLRFSRSRATALFICVAATAAGPAVPPSTSVCACHRICSVGREDDLSSR